MKGDMGGAATVSAAFEAIARLKVPINVTALVPLCENMPSGSANKPGDVVTAMNGKTIEVSDKYTVKETKKSVYGQKCYALKTERQHPRGLVLLKILLSFRLRVVSLSLSPSRETGLKTGPPFACLSPPGSRAVIFSRGFLSRLV